MSLSLSNLCLCHSLVTFCYPGEISTLTDTTFLQKSLVLFIMRFVNRIHHDDVFLYMDAL